MNGMTVDIWIFVIACAVIVLLLLVIVQWVQLRTLRKTFKQFMKGKQGADLEGLIQSIQSKQVQLAETVAEHTEIIRGMKQAMKSMKSKVGIYRYNAFSERGNDLSFSLAIIDEQQNGMVLTGIHSRTETLIYAKPLENGNSKYALSGEEKQAIIQAQEQG